MKYIVIFLAAGSVFIGSPVQSQSPQIEPVFVQSAEQPVMPQSRARRIASALDNWTLESGERPKAIGIAFDCVSSASYVMQNGTGSININRDALPSMRFWGSVSGAAFMKATRNGQQDLEKGEPTEYAMKIGSNEHARAIRRKAVPQFIRDHYEECELIKKRFGG